jgi:hypothetical protein
MQKLDALPLSIIKVADFGLSKHDSSLIFTRVVSLQAGTSNCMYGPERVPLTGTD